ncbi:hypothetical protein EEL31_22585 [Brevibacillus laterosporus]|nr:hypothetical protein [Brevibacillus laterosporus]TPG70957.1 hypothetical protein EEL31_22585 [Brevibacillus laterosporus]
MKRFVAMFSAFVLLCGIILPSTAFAKIAESENVESFETDFLSDEPNEEGLYVKQGTKVVNSIVLTRKANDEVGTVIKKIEDLYNLDGDYINTKITATEFTNNFDTGVAESKVYEEELNQKKAIRNKTKTLLNEENDQEVKKNVEEVFTDVDLSSIESKPEQGIDYKKLEFVDKENAQLKGNGVNKMVVRTRIKLGLIFSALALIGGLALFFYETYNGRGGFWLFNLIKRISIGGCLLTYFILAWKHAK